MKKFTFSFREFMETSGSVTMEDVDRFLSSGDAGVLMDYLQDSGDPDFVEIANFYGIMADDDPYAKGDLYKYYGQDPSNKGFMKIKGERDINLIHTIGNKVTKKINRLIERAGEPFTGDMDYGDSQERLSINLLRSKGRKYFTFHYPYIEATTEDYTERDYNWREFLEEYPQHDRLLAYMFVAEKFFQEERTHLMGHPGNRDQRIILNTISNLIGRPPYTLSGFPNWLQEIIQAFTQAKQQGADRQQLAKLFEWFEYQENYANQRNWNNQMIMQFGQAVETLRNILGLPHPAPQQQQPQP